MAEFTIAIYADKLRLVSHAKRLSDSVIGSMYRPFAPFSGSLWLTFGAVVVSGCHRSDRSNHAFCLCCTNSTTGDYWDFVPS